MTAGSTSVALAELWGVPTVEIWERIGSTNDRATTLAREGAARGAIVLADEQTAGRGRQGATWVSSAGSGLWMSVVLAPDDARPQLPLIVGVACAEAVETLAPVVSVQVKWPNDLLVGDRKLGGILVETSAGAVVVGIGINLTHPERGFPEEVATLATTLEAESGKVLSRNDLAGCVIRILLERLDGADPARAAVEALHDRDALSGRAIESEHRGPGVGAGIDGSGALLLERADGSRVSVVAGSVRLRTDRDTA